jgi:hypothetical protein
MFWKVMFDLKKFKKRAYVFKIGHVGFPWGNKYKMTTNYTIFLLLNLES